MDTTQQLHWLLCLALCPHISPTLHPAAVAAMAWYSAPMLISLDVMFFCVCKVIWFFQICNQLNEHSIILTVPNGIACMMGVAVTMSAYALNFERVWNNLSMYIAHCQGTDNCPCAIPSDMRVTVHHYLVPPHLNDLSLRLLGQVCPCDTDNNPNNYPACQHWLLGTPCADPIEHQEAWRYIFHTRQGCPVSILVNSFYVFSCRLLLDDIPLPLHCHLIITFILRLQVLPPWLSKVT